MIRRNSIDKAYAYLRLSGFDWLSSNGVFYAMLQAATMQHRLKSKSPNQQAWL